MEQTQTINTTLNNFSLVYNIPIEFNINNRRNIKFTIPSLRDSLENVDFNLFLTIISLTKEKLKELKINTNFSTNTAGEIIQGLIIFTDYRNILLKFLLKYIKNSEFKNDDFYVDGERVLSYEFDYIANAFLIGLGLKQYEEKTLLKIEEEEAISPKFKELLDKQILAEEKLKKAKQKKSTNSNGEVLSLEKIILSICFEFNYNYDDLLKLNYYGVLWIFSFVGKVDAHKLNQLILSSGFSKQKKYNYWLNSK